MKVRNRFFGLVLCLVVGGAALGAATTRPAHNSKSWEPTIAKFEAADQNEMPPVGGIEFYGSSTIRIWNIKKAFPGKPVFNRGFGGSWCADCDYYANRVVIPYKPSTIIFYAGDNDIGGGAPAEEVISTFEDFASKVKAALPDTEIVFLSIKPCLSRWKYWPVIQQANSAIAAYCNSNPELVFVDNTSAMLGEDGKPRKELFQKDQLHMNNKGYAIWNKKIATYVDRTTDYGVPRP
jgi:hypothetical protein